MDPIEDIAYEIREDYKDNVPFLHSEEERVIAHLDRWGFEKMTNEEAKRLMDAAREYNTKHHGIKYPLRPSGCILIMPDPKDHAAMTEKAADYLRQHFNKGDKQFDLQLSEEAIIGHLEEWMRKKMTNEEAKRLMDAAREYNTKHHGIKYPLRPHDNIITMPDPKDHEAMVEKAADYMRQGYDSDRPEMLLDAEEDIMIRLNTRLGNITNDEAIEFMDEVRRYNTKHYKADYPPRPPDPVIIMPSGLSADDAKLTMQKAAYYLRYLPDQDPNLEDEIMKRLKRDRWKEISKEQAVRIMADAKKYNTRRYEIKYLPRQTNFSYEDAAQLDRILAPFIWMICAETIDFQREEFGRPTPKWELQDREDALVIPN